MIGYHGENRDVIELRRVFRFFGKTRAVNDVSFSVPRGCDGCVTECPRDGTRRLR